MLAYSSLFVYRKELSNHRQLRDQIKRGNREFITDIVQYKYPELRALPFFQAPCAAVPIPRSSPRVQDSLWPSLIICEALLSVDLVQTIHPVLERVKTVNKAAFSQSAATRPTVEAHRKSISFNPELDTSNYENVILVDDFVTQGRTAYACYLNMLESYQHKNIFLFTLGKTFTRPQNGEEDYNKPFDVKNIHYYSSGNTWREP